MRVRPIQAVLLATLAACGSQTTGAPAASHEQAASSSEAGRPFATREIARFGAPWAMAFLPGSGRPLTNAALVTERTGELWLVDVATGKKVPVSGVPAVHVAGQGGLGDVVAHPDFAGNQRIYLSFAEAGAGGLSGAALGYGTLDLRDPAHPALRDFRTIWRQEPKIKGGNHYSHRIAFSPDGYLFLTSGERFQFTPAQDLGNNLGKVLRLTAEGRPAPGNPFAERGGVAAQIWSYGHRNLLGLAFAPDGRLWEDEMGPQGGDELNLILPGRNYGWPKASNGSNYDDTGIADHRPGDGFEPPKLWWNPSISPSSLLIYDGDKFPQWKGDALIGALSGEALVRVDIDGDTARKADEWPMGARIRAVDQGPDGEVYVLEDKGRLLRLDPR